MKSEKIKWVYKRAKYGNPRYYFAKIKEVSIVVEPDYYRRPDRWSWAISVNRIRAASGVCKSDALAKKIAEDVATFYASGEIV